MDSECDVFHGAAVDYAEILGETGLAAYRRLAEAEWNRLPALAPGDRDADRGADRFRITSIMESLARASDDPDELVAVKSRDLSTPYAFLQIAEIYQQAGQTDRAVDWAERGLRAFPAGPRDDRLRVFLADAYQARGRDDDALALTWAAFGERPGLETFRRLKRHAKRAKAWPVWRDKAIGLVRERIAAQRHKAPDSRRWVREPWADHSLLVEILLDEGDAPAAWEGAKAGGCSTGLWLRLAKKRESRHPDDAVRVYKEYIARLLRNTGDSVYRETVQYMEKIEALLDRSGETRGFRAYLTEIRATHRRKRNLMKLLERKG